jgi:ribonuclease HII
MRETAEQKLERLVRIERELWDKGRAVAGMDEVGRGPLAGPVVTACVSIPRHRLVPGVDDSKKLSEKVRESLYDRLIDAADYCEITYIPREIIDEINILNATRLAMEKSAAGFRQENGIILIDALDGLSLPCEGRVIIHGDQESYMIAAASVIAKVSRDRHMIKLDKIYPQYGFARHKGYGTQEHIAALREYGPCPEHRRTFLGHFLNEIEEERTWESG